MNRLRFDARWALCCLSAFAPLVAFASCADTERDHETPDGSSPIPAPQDDAASEAEPDGACDAADESCEVLLTCEQAPWCPVATNASLLAALTSVWGSSKSDVWASGSNGTVVHWDGAAWTAVPSPTTTEPPILPVKNTFNSVWGSGPSDVWIASATDAVFHATGYAGSATKWERAQMPVEIGADVPLFAVWGTAASDVRMAGRATVVMDDDGNYVVVNGFATQSLADGGGGWRGMPAGTATVLGMWGSSANDVWLVGENSAEVPWQLSVSLHGTAATDGAFTWTEVDTRALPTLRAIWGSSANDVWAVGDRGTIRHVVNGDAAEWLVVASPTDQNLRAVWGSAADDIWAVGDRGAIVHYDGKGWKPILAAFPAGKKPMLSGVWGSGRDDVWIVGSGGALHYTGDELDRRGGSK